MLDSLTAISEGSRDCCPMWSAIVSQTFRWNPWIPHYFGILMQDLINLKCWSWGRHTIGAGLSSTTRTYFAAPVHLAYEEFPSSFPRVLRLCGEMCIGTEGTPSVYETEHLAPNQLSPSWQSYLSMLHARPCWNSSKFALSSKKRSKLVKSSRSWKHCFCVIRDRPASDLPCSDTQ